MAMVTSLSWFLTFVVYSGTVVRRLEIGIWSPTDDFLSDGYPYLIACYFSPNETCDSNSTMELFDEESHSVLQVEKCDSIQATYNHSHSFAIRRPPNETRLFGKLRCRNVDPITGETAVSNNSLIIPFLPCDVYSDVCSKEEHCAPGDDEPAFCIVTKSGTQPCSKIKDPNLCRFDYGNPGGYRYCPVDELGRCDAALKNYSAAWFVVVLGNCPANVTAPPVSYKGKLLLYKDTFAFDPSTTVVNFDCPSGGPCYNATIDFSSATISGLGGKIDIRVPCLDKVGLNVSEALSFGTASSLVSIHAILNSSIFFFKYEMVTFGNDLNASAEKELQCVLTRGISRWIFRVTKWWTKATTGNRRLDKQTLAEVDFGEPFTLRREDLTEYQTDVYQCHVIIRYQTCSPYRTFASNVISSNKVWFYYSTTTISTTTESAPSPSKSCDLKPSPLLILSFSFYKIIR